MDYTLTLVICLLELAQVLLLAALVYEMRRL